MTDSSELVHTDDNLVIELPPPSEAEPHAGSPSAADVLLVLPAEPGGSATSQSPPVVRLNAAINASRDLIMVVDPAGKVLFANETARCQLRMTGVEPTVEAVKSLLDGPESAAVLTSLRDSNQWNGSISATAIDGSNIELEVSVFPDTTNTGDIRVITLVGHRADTRQTSPQVEEPLTTHDGLTGLSNRQHLLAELNKILPELAAEGQSSALLVVDIDEFRTVTNSLGHEAGDRVLVAFAYRLLRSFDSGTILARVGGDEFAIFCPREDDIATLSARIRQATAAPFYIEGTEVHLSVVTGIAIASPDSPAANGEALLRDADAASHRGKEHGRGSFEVFEPQLHADAADRLGVMQGLRQALRGNEFRLLYQPRISLTSGEIIGAEALIRWQTADGELRSPAGFMDVAEDTGLIIPIGRWVLHAACEAAAEFQQLRPGHGFDVSINLSVRQLASAGFADDVEAALKSSGIDPAFIELEITESALMDDVDASAEILEQLSALGTRIAVDDFGTGYSSLQYLQRLPVDVLKVDQSFVAGLGQNEGDQAIVAAVVQLAKALRLTSVAEGVETAAQLACLRTIGCDHAQGYYMARPMTAEALAELMATQPSW